MNIPFLKMETVYTIRVVYKSGFVQDFEATEFAIGGNKAEWVSVGSVKPVMLGLDDISAAWQIGSRRRIAR